MDRPQLKMTKEELIESAERDRSVANAWLYRADRFIEMAKDMEPGQTIKQRYKKMSHFWDVFRGK